MSQIEYITYHGFEGLNYCPSKGYYPKFLNAVMERIHKKMACNVVFTGEAGVSKSYLAMQIARIIEGKKDNGEDRFSLDQVVFTYKDFMELVLKLPSDKLIVFDEPSYSMGKRDWYKDLNKALVQTIESFRFKRHPLEIPIINISLLDKTVRDYLLQFQVVVTDRGIGEAYKLLAGQFEEKTWREHICRLEYPIMDADQCDRDSCLDCSKIDSCELFRARYERKKASIQEYRYEQAYDLAESKEATLLTDAQLELLLLDLTEHFIKENGKIDVQSMRVALQDMRGIKLSQARAYKLKRQFETHHKELLSAMTQ